MTLTPVDNFLVHEHDQIFSKTRNSETIDSVQLNCTLMKLAISHKIAMSS